MVKLDFTLNTDRERKEFAENLISQTPHLTNSELETIANYILYGKGEDGESVVDKKEVEISTKYRSYKKKEPESLDELLEKPAFDEGVFSFSRNRYKTVKPKIDREKDKEIPGIQELWASIDKIQHIIDCNCGKIEDPSIRKLSPLELYKYKHMVIDLRRQQFYLKDIFNPTICMFGTNAKKNYEVPDIPIPWDFQNSDFSIAPLGILIGKDQKFYSPRTYRGPSYTHNENATYIIDFRNMEHIYYLLENYEDLRIGANNEPESTIGFLLDTLDFYIQLAKLGEVKTLILENKKVKVHNESIREKLEREYGVTHSSNYISTIWKQRICSEIAEAAKLHYDYYLNREKPFAWKKCNQCGEFKLKDTREFMRKTRSSDGLSNKCKECDKVNRAKSKK